MKKSLTLLLGLLLTTIALKAQDIITLTDGTQIRAKVLEINPTDVKYKDFNNQDGPTTTVLKSNVASIRYQNGTKTLFNESSSGNKPAGGHFVKGSGNERMRDRDEGQGDKYVSFKKRREKNQLRGWYFGLDLMFGGGAASNTDPNYTTSGGSHVAFDVLATKMFNQHVGLQFGLGENAYDYGVNFYSGNFGYPDDVFSVSYVTFPVRAVYFSNSKHRAGFYAMGGLDLSILTRATDNEQDDLGNYFRSFVVSPNVACGVDVRGRGGRSAWMFGLYYKVTLNNFYTGKPDVLGYLDPGNDGRLGGLGISINYMMKFRGQRI